MYYLTGEGNGTPLQYFCLENPRDGAAWWAAVYGVAQSRTRLKRLSSSSILPNGHSWWLSTKESTYSLGPAGDMGSILGSGRSPGGGYGIPLQYSCLENPMDRGNWRATDHRVEKSRTRLKRLSTYARILPNRYQALFWRLKLQQCTKGTKIHGLVELTFIC